MRTLSHIRCILQKIIRNNSRKIGRSLGVLIIFFMCIMLNACKSDNTEVKKVKDLEFTVVEDSDIPEGLKSIIDEKKEKPFKISYTNKEYFYIVVGYGEQKTGGYSITVEDLFLTKNSIYIDTNLLGPPKDEVVTQALTYPYIVVKIEYMEKNVEFN